MISCASAPRGH